METSEKRFLLLHGTQTGQSKAIAEEFADRCKRIGILADIHSLSRVEKDFALEKEDVAVIVLSSTGSGDPPETVEKFWRRIKRKSLPKNLLAHLKYSLLGLGDSNYDSFAQCPRMVNDRLAELGAVPFIKTQFADEAEGLDTVADPWMEAVLLGLANMFNVVPSSAKDKDVEVLEKQLAAVSMHDKSESMTDGTGYPRSGRVDQLTSSPSGQPTIEDNGKISHNWTSDIPVLGGQLTLPSLPSSYLNIEYTNSISKIDLPPQSRCKLPFAESDVIWAEVKDTQVLTTTDAVKKTLMVELDCKGFTDYHSGDSFAVLARNEHSEVSWLLDRMEIAEPEAMVHLSVDPQTTKRKALVPEFINNPSSLLEIFTASLDIRSTPKKAFLRLLSTFCSDDVDRQKLAHLSSKQGADLYRHLLVESHKGLIDILHSFPSCRPTAEALLENLPRLLPRAYSVASASGAGLLKFVFNVVNLSPVGPLTTRSGLVTGMFDEIHKTSAYPSVGMYLRNQHTFRLPSHTSTPLILIGPGTGIAPFIGFLADRKREMQAGKTLGECLLFFGNRNESKDFLFREELSHHVSIGSLTALHVCFSRDAPAIPSKGKYVTDLLRQQSAHVSRLITSEGAYIYVCGEAKNMAKNVRETITDILQKQNGYTDDDVVSVMKSLRNEKRYREDVWL